MARSLLTVQVGEDTRLRYIREPDAAKRMALLIDTHKRLWEVVSHLPLGQLIQPFLWRSNVTGVLRSDVLAFWKIGKT
jgi:peptide/nickel transport system substrate-binding protein